MKSTHFAVATTVAAASGFTLALALATPQALADEQYRPAQAPIDQSGPVRRLDPVPGADRSRGQGQGVADPSLGQVPPAAPMTSKRAEDIADAKLVDEAGKEIGEVEGIVRGKATGTLHALISVGGVLGMGDKEVTIPLSAVQLVGNQLTSPLAITEDQLKAQPTYDQTFYEEVPDDQQVQIGTGGGIARAGTGAGLGADQTAGSTFDALDSDHDGYVSKEEAQGKPALIKQWGRADANRDDRLDQGEFAAFEAADPMASPENRAPQ